MECQEKVNNLLVRSFQIILTNTETLPCKISREQTIDSDTFSKKKNEMKLNFTLNLRIFQIIRLSIVTWKLILTVNLWEKKTKLSSLRTNYSYILSQSRRKLCWFVILSEIVYDKTEKFMKCSTICAFMLHYWTKF